jgi:NAD(P)-dependent dehydrogenase (short-subunit alcohol dehydrogenase family)
MATMELAGRVALVTGGGSGIGRTAARRFAAEGMRVCVVDLDGDAARAVAHEIGGLAVTADVSSSAQVDAAFAACVAGLGGLDLAYLNAGKTAGIPDIAELTDEAYERTRSLNLDGVVFGARAAVRAFRNRADGRTGGVLVVTASIVGIDPATAPDPIYPATKHAVVGLLRALAPALAGEGIAVHAICPGLTDTPLIPGEIKSAFAQMGLPILTPEQVADAVVAAATADIALSGTCWVVHPGGTVAHEFNPVHGPHDGLLRIR